MKKILLVFSVLLMVTAQAQTSKYATAMQNHLSRFDSARTTADFESLAAGFTRIGEAEKNQWLPYYWAGLALTNIGWRDQKTDRDELAGRIIALCDKADALAPDSAGQSEILSLRNMAATQQMLVDPQSRYMSYGKQASDDLQKAMKLNPLNPRLYYLQGMSIFNTPEQFGGGKTKARPLFQKAVDLYGTETSKPLYPHWGQEQARQMLAQCQ